MAKKLKYKEVKFFDCQDMPDGVRAMFFEQAGSPSFRGGNDCVVEWMLWGKCGSKCVSGPNPDYPYDNPERTYGKITDQPILEDRMDSGYRYIIQKGDDIVSDWLYENGAEMYERVLIKHWW